ncbi:MAG: 2-oxoacid:acceptor oxidoreductase family protein [Pseudomonadota bacterium]
MMEIRFHGRGGQGAVTAAELMAQAAILDGKYAQAFPNFGPERRGAPVTAFLRVSDQPIYLREKIESPDTVVVLDPTLIDLVNVADGLKPGGMMVMNLAASGRGALAKYGEQFQVAAVDASRIAVETIGIPVTNTAILGSLIKACGITSLKTMEGPMERRFGRLAAKNLLALQRAFEETEVFEAPAAPPAQDAPGVQEVGTYVELLQREALLVWDQLQIGCDIDLPGSTAAFHTGNWRSAGRPYIDRDKCVSCGFCHVYCPDLAMNFTDDGAIEWDHRYCKGCGICAEECPKGAISMREESHEQ